MTKKVLIPILLIIIIGLVAVVAFMVGKQQNPSEEVDTTIPVEQDTTPTPDPEPEPTGREGSVCNENSDCLSGLYCAKTGSNVCTSGVSGTCELQPEICTRHYDPVCGCNGETYGNACEAQAAGQNISSEGAC